MALQESWHVRSRSRTCAATERPFTDGESIITALFPDPDTSGYLRRDYALEAWQDQSEDAEKPFSFWRNTYAAPVDHSADDPVKKLSADELLARLVEEDEDHTENTRYILAVMLERQRVLRETDSQRTPDGIIRVYENRKTGDIFIVRDPNIPLDEVERVQEEVMLLLQNNGRRPEPTATDPTATDPTDPDDPATP
jgi:hypothetical protein